MSNSKNRNSKLPPKEYLDKIKGYRNLVNSLGGSPATRYTLTEDISNKLFEPGLYVIGELSEFEKDLTNIDMHDQRLEDFYEGYWFDINGVFRAMQGSLFANLKTCWGDGIYIDNQGNEQNVDHGSIGCISAKEVILGDYNKVALFPKPFTVNYDISTGIIRFGNIFIDTDFAEVGNREIYFYDPSNTYEPDHPSNKDKTYIDVKIIEYYKVKDLYPKQKAKINWELINYIKDVETKRNQWGEKTNDYGFKSITSMDLLEEIFRKINTLNDSDDQITINAIKNYLEKSKNNFEEWIIKQKKENLKLKENAENQYDLYGRKAKPVKILFDEDTYLAGIDLKRIEHIINTALNFLKDKSKYSN